MDSHLLKWSTHTNAVTLFLGDLQNCNKSTATKSNGLFVDIFSVGGKIGRLLVL